MDIKMFETRIASFKKGGISKEEHRLTDLINKYIAAQRQGFDLRRMAGRDIAELSKGRVSRNDALEIGIINEMIADAPTQDIESSSAVATAPEVRTLVYAPGIVIAKQLLKEAGFSEDVIASMPSDTSGAGDVNVSIPEFVEGADMIAPFEARQWLRTVPMLTDDTLKDEDFMLLSNHDGDRFPLILEAFSGDNALHPSAASHPFMHRISDVTGTLVLQVQFNMFDVGIEYQLQSSRDGRAWERAEGATQVPVAADTLEWSTNKPGPNQFWVTRHFQAASKDQILRLVLKATEQVEA